jgi:hypothetical protein
MRLLAKAALKPKGEIAARVAKFLACPPPAGALQIPL